MPFIRMARYGTVTEPAELRRYYLGDHAAAGLYFVAGYEAVDHIRDAQKIKKKFVNKVLTFGL